MQYPSNINLSRFKIQSSSINNFVEWAITNMCTELFYFMKMSFLNYSVCSPDVQIKHLIYLAPSFRITLSVLGSQIVKVKCKAAISLKTSETRHRNQAED